MSFWDKVFGKSESEEHWSVAASAAQLNDAAATVRQEMEDLKYEMLRNQALSNQYQQLGPSGFQNTLANQMGGVGGVYAANSLMQQNMLAAAQQAQQARAEQKFKEEAAEKGAVSPAELDSVAYSLSLEEVRTLWLAAFGSKWVAQESLEGDHRLMFMRLYENFDFEKAVVTDTATRTFKLRYRLKGS